MFWTVSAAAVAGLLAVPELVDTSLLPTLSLAVALGLVSVGVTVLTGRAGLPTLGQAAPYAVGAYTTALLGRSGLDSGPAQAVAACAAAALYGLLTGPVVVRARGVTALMITLAFGELTTTAAARWKSVTGGTDGLIGIPATRAWWDGPALTDDPDVYRYAVVVAAVAVLATVAALRAPLGRLPAGCRDHEQRMRADGHRVNGVLLGAYVWAAALAGLGGHLLVAAQRYVSPADVGFVTSSLCLLAAVLGGIASPLGALGGTALVVLTRDQVAAHWPGHGPLLLGALFVAAVYLLPRGAAGVLSVPRRRSRPAPGSPEPPNAQPPPLAALSSYPVGGHSVNALLTLAGVTRRYGALTAVDGLDLTVEPGARHAVIGPNGAGKSTLLGLVAGTVTPTEGRILLEGKDISGTDPATRSRLGIARTFQQPAVLGTLSALDNVALAAWRHTELRGLWRPRQYRELGRHCRDHLDQVGIAHLAGTTAGQLSHGQQRLLEIAAALASRPRVLLLDEPAAGLTGEDTERLVKVLRQVSGEVALLLVEHDLDFVAALADRVTVLHGGRVIADGTPDRIAADPAVQDAYLGRPAE